MLRIWGRISSVNTRKVVWCAQELGLEFERIDAGMHFGIVDTPEFRRLNPNGKVPVLEEDGFVLWESNAIVRYLAEKHGYGSLYPSDLRVRADAGRWMDWQTSNFNPTMLAAFRNWVRVPAEQRDHKAIEAARIATEPLTQMLDNVLAEREYLTGAFTMADIAVGCTAHNWLNLPMEYAPRPNLMRWYESLRARPATRNVLTLPLQ